MRRILSILTLAAVLGAGLSLVSFHRAVRAQGFSTTNYQVIPACVFTPTTTAADTGFPAPQLITAGEVTVNTYQTNTTAGTVEVTCTFNVPIVSSPAGTSLTATSLDVNYSIVTTTLTTFANPTFNSLTIPATAGGSATGTVATTAGGTLTFTPSTIQKAAVTAGLVYRLNIAFGTPIALSSAIKSYAVDFALTTAGTSKTRVDLYPFTLYVKG